MATALHPPSLESVKLDASKLQHPLIRPLEIDGRKGFSPDEIAVMTLLSSPALRALRAQRGVSRAQLVQAGLLPNPQLAYSFDRVQRNGDPALINGTSLGLSWEVTALLAHRDVTSAARATAEALDLSIAWQEWQAAQDARLRTFRVLSVAQRIPLARELESDLAQALDEFRRAVADRLRVGADLTAATDAWRRAQTDRFALERQIVVDRSAINLAIGQPADAQLALRRDEAFPALSLPAVEDLLSGLEDRRVDLVALRIGYSSQEATLRAAIKAQFPKLNVNLARARDTSDIHTHSLGFTLDLPVFDRGQNQIAIAQATRQQLFDEYLSRVAEARSQVREIVAEISLTQKELAAVESALPNLEKQAAVLDRAKAEGSIETSVWREARGALSTHQIEQSQLQQSLLELEVGLELATGRPLLNRAPIAATP